MSAALLNLRPNSWRAPKPSLSPGMWVLAAHAAAAWWLMYAVAAQIPVPNPLPQVSVRLLTPELMLPQPQAPAPSPKVKTPDTTPATQTPLESAQPAQQPFQTLSPLAFAAAPAEVAPSPTPQALKAEPAPSVAPTPQSALPPLHTGTPPKPTAIVLPTSTADYLNNPAPPYPPIAKRLGESGRVVVRALIGIDGNVQRAELKTSSGFERLDQIAVETVQRWRFKPGLREGEPEAMWVNVPIDFKLD